MLLPSQALTSRQPQPSECCVPDQQGKRRPSRTCCISTTLSWTSTSAPCSTMMPTLTCIKWAGLAGHPATSVPPAGSPWSSSPTACSSLWCIRSRRWRVGGKVTYDAVARISCTQGGLFRVGGWYAARQVGHVCYVGHARMRKWAAWQAHRAGRSGRCFGKGTVGRQLASGKDRKCHATSMSVGGLQKQLRLSSCAQQSSCYGGVAGTCYNLQAKNGTTQARVPSPKCKGTCSFIGSLLESGWT